MQLVNCDYIERVDSMSC